MNPAVPHRPQPLRPVAVPERVFVGLGNAGVVAHAPVLPAVLAANGIEQLVRVVVGMVVAERFLGVAEEVLTIDKSDGPFDRGLFHRQHLQTITPPGPIRANRGGASSLSTCGKRKFGVNTKIDSGFWLLRIPRNGSEAPYPLPIRICCPPRRHTLDLEGPTPRRRDVSGRTLQRELSRSVSVGIRRRPGNVRRPFEIDRPVVGKPLKGAVRAPERYPAGRQTLEEMPMPHAEPAHGGQGDLPVISVGMRNPKNRLNDHNAT